MRRLSPADFDPQAVAEYNITADDLRRVERYLRLLQGPDALTLRDIAVGGYYGTAALLHEVVELDILLEREPRLLEWSPESAQCFFRANLDAHAEALAAEHRYLQNQIAALFHCHVSLGALVMVNAGRDDLEILVTSDVAVPLWPPHESDVERARWLLERLKAVGKDKGQ